MTKAAAILLQDDFYHYQATLAHALDESCWWNPARLLPDEASAKDVKRVLAAFQDDDDANTVASARGWMRVLIQKHGQVGPGSPLSQLDLDVVTETFKRLEQGRCSLKTLARRRYSPFGSRLVMEGFKKETVEKIRLFTAIDCPQPEIESLRTYPD